MSNKIIDNLYDYQKEVVEICKLNNQGIIVLPTGTGKTYIEASIVADDILNHPNQFRIYVINAPRIILSFQLFNEFYKVLCSTGIDSRYMFVHSGGTTDESELELMRTSFNDSNEKQIPFSEVMSGTSIPNIKEMMSKAKQQNLPLVIFSTYNSADRIELARLEYEQELNDEFDDDDEIKIPISITLSDEAHYLVQEQFHDILKLLTSKRSYFFTATTINTPSDKGRGMNNTELYGEVLYMMTPREAIDRGKMVRPRLHFINTDDVYSTDDYRKSLSKIIYEAYHQHKTLNKLSSKILISVKGTKDIVNFLSSEYYKILINEGVTIYAVASNEEIGNNINGQKVRRQEFLNQLKIDGNNKDKNLVVLHYDILAEGIDVSGFTGILPLRTLNKSKFLQTFGRASRLDLEDKYNIENNIVDKDELHKLNKPFSFIIIPNVIHSNEDDKINFINLVTELRSYGFKPSEHIITSSIINGIPKIEPINGINELLHKLPNVGELIENLEADIEAEENAKLEKDDFLIRFI